MPRTRRGWVVTSEELVDHDIREALAQALGERNRMLYRRLLVAFVFLVAATTLVLWRQGEEREQFDRGIVTACAASRENAHKFNDLIDRIRTTYRTSPVLTPRQRAARIAFFEGADQTIPRCPPRR